jgi:hypothetical protein
VTRFYPLAAVANKRLTRPFYPAGMDVGFKRIKWFAPRSAYKDMVSQRQRRAEGLKKTKDMMDAINTAMSNAQQNKISGSSMVAAQAALKRVQSMAKAKSDEITKQIDSAQNLVDTTQSSSTTTTTTGTSTILDTVA